MIDRKQLELDALLEVSQAINANVSEEALYKIFYFTCLSIFQFEAIALLVFEENGARLAVANNLSLTDEQIHILQEKTISKGVNTRESAELGSDFTFLDVLIPVMHKNKKLALVLLADEELAYSNKKDQYTFIQTLANVIMVAIENKRFVRREIKQEALRREMEIASEVQSLLFPKSLPQTKNISFFASYLPHSSVGGDYYDCIALSENEYLFCIADVSGKGVPAALIMSNFQACLRTLAHFSAFDLERIVKELNHQIFTSAQGEKFITLFLAKYNVPTKELLYINCGHNPSLLLQDGKVKKMEIGTTVLGAFENLPFINEGKEQLLSGALIVNYTDGVTETVNSEMEEYGEDRLDRFFSTKMHEPLPDLHQDLIIEIDGFKQGNPYRDDFTLLMVRVGEDKGSKS